MCKANNIFERVLNLSNQKIKLYKNQKIGVGRTVDDKVSNMSTVFEVSVNDKINYESHNDGELNDALNYVPQEVSRAAQLPQYPDPTCFLLYKLSLDGLILSEEAKILLNNIILKHFRLLLELMV